MPNRILKESINESRGLTSCSFFAQDLYKRLITYADDYGRFNADPQIMLARLYPRELAIVLLDDLTSGLIELVGVGKIMFYTSTIRDDVYGAFPNWGEHQRIRDSKKKAPEPDDTTVNDWYLRRFIPMEIKVEVIQRDEFKCQICGKHLWNGDIDDAKRFAKLGCGLFHIDHEVPVNQGGRATLENLRLTCPKCNLSRKKSFSFDEVLQFAKSRGKSRQDAARCGLNPIHSKSIPNPETDTNPRARAGAAADLPTPDSPAAYASSNLQYMSPHAFEELATFQQDLPDDVILHGIDAACNQGKRTWAYTRSILNRYVSDGYKSIGDVVAAEDKHKRQGGTTDRNHMPEYKDFDLSEGL